MRTCYHCCWLKLPIRYDLLERAGKQMSDGSVLQAYYCNVCLPTVAEYHSQIASRNNSEVFCKSLAEWWRNRRRSGGRIVHHGAENLFFGRGRGRGCGRGRDHDRGRA